MRIQQSSRLRLPVPAAIRLPNPWSAVICSRERPGKHVRHVSVAERRHDESQKAGEAQVDST